MKSMAAIAVIVALTTLPVCAQRGMAGGGFAGHGASVGRGGFSAPVSRGSGGGGFRAPSGSYAYRPPVAINRYPAGNSGFRPAYHPGYAYHNPGYGYHYPGHGPYWPGHWPGYWNHGVYITTVWPGYYYPYFWGYPGWGYSGFSDDSDDSQSYPNYEQQAPAQNYGYYGPESSAYEAPAMPSDYAQSQRIGGSSHRMPYTGLSAQSAGTPEQENPVTLIFRNGSAPRQVHNYMLTATTLWVLDQTYQEIPLNQIDIAATVAKNREAGIDFHVPGGSH
jgi:hypothetical protein